MVRIIKKRVYLMLGLLVGGIISSIGTHIRSQYTKSSSWIIPSAHADVQPYVWEPGGCGDGSGGCSGCDTGS